LERDERDRRDEVAILRVKLNAENAVRMMVEKLVALNVSEKEIVEAIQHLTHEAERKAVFALSKRPPSSG
jgi:alkylhydroperoxidase/carboxymuconolactone decarboxylase family protein YurZ